MMDAAGVDFQVLSATPQVPQFGTAEEALALAQDINNTYKDIISRYPDRFRASGVVPLPHVEAAIQEGKRIIEELGFLGIASIQLWTMACLLVILILNHFLKP